jgi:hypothetical protein
MYPVILFSYLHPGRELATWIHLLAGLPALFLSNFVFSNLIVLPILFVVTTIVARIQRLKGIVTLPDGALLSAGLFLFLFMNAAPPYYGWQMRGEWVARLFQPVFPAYLMAIARVTQQLAGPRLRLWVTVVVLAIVANGSIAFGPVLLNPIAAYTYHRFYMHSPPESLLINLRRFGRRPLGFCSTTHEWDNIPNPNTPQNRPSFMFRYPRR